MSRFWLAIVLGLCWLVSGCGVDNSAELPVMPPPMPTEGPTNAGSSSAPGPLPPAAP